MEQWERGREEETEEVTRSGSSDDEKRFLNRNTSRVAFRRGRLPSERRFPHSQASRRGASSPTSLTLIPVHWPVGGKMVYIVNLYHRRSIRWREKKKKRKKVYVTARATEPSRVLFNDLPNRDVNDFLTSISFSQRYRLIFEEIVRYNRIIFFPFFRCITRWYGSIIRHFW